MEPEANAALRENIPIGTCVVVVSTSAIVQYRWHASLQNLRKN